MKDLITVTDRAASQIKKIINEINLSDQYKQSLTSEELIRIVLDKISITYD